VFILKRGNKLKIREYLFSKIPGLTGCQAHGCVVTGGKDGPRHNGSCKCFEELSRLQLSMLKTRINTIGDKLARDEGEEPSCDCDEYEQLTGNNGHKVAWISADQSAESGWRPLYIKKPKQPKTFEKKNKKVADESGVR